MFKSGEPRSGSGSGYSHSEGDRSPVSQKRSGDVALSPTSRDRVRVNRSIAFLLRASKILSSSLEMRTTLRDLADAVIPSIADKFVLDLVAEDGNLTRAAQGFSNRDIGVSGSVRASDSDAASTTNGNESFSAVRAARRELLQRLLEEAVRTGVPYLLNHAVRCPKGEAQYLKRYATRLHELGLESTAIVPIASKGVVLAVAAFSVSTGRRAYDQRDMEMFTELARRIATAIENSRLWLAAESAKQELMRANRAKDDFLAVMSHELRTPLNAIAGYCQMLLMGLRGDINQGQKEDLERISQNQNHLLRLINSILNYTKLDGGEITYEMKKVSVVNLLAQIEQDFRPSLSIKAINLSYDLPHKAQNITVAPQSTGSGISAEDGDVFIIADEERVYQILVNLLSNAIKYSGSNKTITVGYQVGDNHVHIFVKDTGPGIDPSHLDRIFDPFVQVERTLSTYHEGVGLGLSISRDLARAMGGDITVQSREGEGATFLVTFPRS